MQEESDTIRTLREENERLRRQMGLSGQTRSSASPPGTGSFLPQFQSHGGGYLDQFVSTFMAQRAAREVDHYREELDRERAASARRELRNQDERLALVMSLFLGQAPGDLSKKPPPDF